jgi:hypothetical protein
MKPFFYLSISIFLLWSAACSNSAQNTPLNQIIFSNATEKPNNHLTTSGVLVWNGNKAPIKIFNESGQVKTILTMRQMLKSTVKPFAFHEDYSLCVFQVISNENGYFKVLLNEETSEYGYIEAQTPLFEYQTMAAHLLTLFAIEPAHQTDLKIAPNDTAMISTDLYGAEESAVYQTECKDIDGSDIVLKPILVDKAWLKVAWEDKSGQKRTAWVRWTDGKNILIEFFYFR